jgi:DNA-binding NtrC family response regulator
MKRAPCVLIVDADILVRHPLAEYLRECGYRAVQSADTNEAWELFTRSRRRRVIDVVLADVNAPGAENTFALATWIHAKHARVEVILAGTVDAATQKAGDLCGDCPTLSKPYHPQLLLVCIRRALAARDRTA